MSGVEVSPCCTATRSGAWWQLSLRYGLVAVLIAAGSTRSEFCGLEAPEGSVCRPVPGAKGQRAVCSLEQLEQKCSCFSEPRAMAHTETPKVHFSLTYAV